jgi:MFS family permease
VRRWLAVICISSASICVTCASSMVRPGRSQAQYTLNDAVVLTRIYPLTRPAGWQAAFAEVPIARQFHVSKEVAILGVSLFVLGLGLGPLVAGPMSEVHGRNMVYRVSFSLFFVCMFPVAFAPNICMCVARCLSVGSLAWFDNAMRVGSYVSGLSVYLRVLRGRVSQRGRGKCL